jgi:hypothetical protein
MAIPAAKPTDAPVITRPISSPGRSFQAARTAMASIIVATAVSIMPRRPSRAAMELSRCNTAIVLPAKIAKTTVTVRAER